MYAYERGYYIYAVNMYFYTGTINVITGAGNKLALVFLYLLRYCFNLVYTTLLQERYQLYCA